MSYPEKYDEKLKFWRLDTLPFIPEEYKYEVIPNVQKQFNTIQSLLTREDVSTIYVATDSGREGEYIYRLVEQMTILQNHLIHWN
jgi:DNA topoisomerase-3